MSVTQMEFLEKLLPTEFPRGTWMCEECHKECVTSMNIGYGKRGTCERCGDSRHFVYMII